MSQSEFHVDHNGLLVLSWKTYSDRQKLLPVSLRVLYPHAEHYPQATGSWREEWTYKSMQKNSSSPTWWTRSIRPYATVQRALAIARGWRRNEVFRYCQRHDAMDLLLWMLKIKTFYVSVWFCLNFSIFHLIFNCHQHFPELAARSWLRVPRFPGSTLSIVCAIDSFHSFDVFTRVLSIETIRFFIFVSAGSLNPN